MFYLSCERLSGGSFLVFLHGVRVENPAQGELMEQVRQHVAMDDHGQFRVVETFTGSVPAHTQSPIPTAGPTTAPTRRPRRGRRVEDRRRRFVPGVGRLEVFSFWQSTSERHLLAAQILAADLATEDGVESTVARLQSRSLVGRLAWQRFTRRRPARSCTGSRTSQANS